MFSNSVQVAHGCLSLYFVLCYLWGEIGAIRFNHFPNVTLTLPVRKRSLEMMVLHWVYR